MNFQTWLQDEKFLEAARLDADLWACLTQIRLNGADYEETMRRLLIALVHERLRLTALLAERGVK